MNARPISRSERIAMIRDMTASTSIRGIARHLGTCPKTIRDLAAANGIALKQHPTPRPAKDRPCKRCELKRTFMTAYNRPKWMCIPCESRTSEPNVIRWRENHPDKFNAQKQLQHAVATNRLVRGKCEVCGSGKAHGHHEDYSKPLDVIWLCAKHHAERHLEIKATRRLAGELKQFHRCDEAVSFGLLPLNPTECAA